MSDVTDIETEESLSLEQRLESLNGYISVLPLIEEIKKSEVVSKELAMEVFTMLPPMVNYSNHFTKAASAYNRTFVMNKFTPHDKRDEVRAFLEDLLRAVYDVKPQVDEVFKIAEAFKSLTAVEVEKFAKIDPIVVFPGGKWSLLTDPIRDIANTDDSLYKFAPYEGVLADKYQKLDAAVSSFKFSYSASDYENLNGLYKYLLHICDWYINSDKMFNNLVSKLCDYSLDTGTKYLIEDAFNFLNMTRIDGLLFVGDDSIASQVLDLLKFLR